MNSVDKVKAICKSRKIPISRLERDLGFANAYISQLTKGKIPTDRLLAISKYLDIPFEELLGDDEKAPALTEKDERDIAKDLKRIMAQLDAGGDLMFDGDPMSDEARESIKSAMKLGLEAAKAKNKERFTPKKYRKE